MDDKTRRETLKWIKKARSDAIAHYIRLVEHLDRLEEMLVE